MIKRLMMVAAIALTAPLSANAAVIDIFKNGSYDGGETDLASGTSVSFEFQAAEDLRVLNFISLTGNGSSADLEKVSYGINGSMTAFEYTGPPNNATAAATAFLPGFVLMAGDVFTIDFTYAGSGNPVDVDYIFETAAVPVPAAGLMLLTAVGGLAAARRRNKKNA